MHSSPSVYAENPGCRARRPRSYGSSMVLVQIAGLMVACVAWFAPAPAEAADRPVQVVALGDSLTAGYGLPGDAAFPARLEKALRAKGLSVEVANAGVSGDT